MNKTLYDIHIKDSDSLIKTKLQKQYKDIIEKAIKEYIVKFPVLKHVSEISVVVYGVHQCRINGGISYRKMLEDTEGLSYSVKKISYTEDLEYDFDEDPYKLDNEYDFINKFPYEPDFFDSDQKEQGFSYLEDAIKEKFERALKYGIRNILWESRLKLFTKEQIWDISSSRFATWLAEKHDVYCKKTIPEVLNKDFKKYGLHGEYKFLHKLYFNEGFIDTTLNLELKNATFPLFLYVDKEKKVYSIVFPEALHEMYQEYLNKEKN